MCACEIGRYMKDDEGLDNVTCGRCEQWPFRTTTMAGATGPVFCSCHVDKDAGGYSGLLQKSLDIGPQCGCPDVTFLDHIGRACVKFSIYEDCSGAWPGSCRV
jgi:hypothetical protein